MSERAESYFLRHQHELESVLATALETTFTEQPEDPVVFLAHCILASRAGPDKVATGCSEARGAGIAALREKIRKQYLDLANMHGALADMQAHTQAHTTTRSHFLQTLADRIGPMPARAWTDEWPALAAQIPVAAAAATHPSPPRRGTIRESRFHQEE
eukprot:3801887-Prymnesium_polylepis.2